MEKTGSWQASGLCIKEVLARNIKIIVGSQDSVNVVARFDDEEEFGNIETKVDSSGQLTIVGKNNSNSVNISGGSTIFRNIVSSGSISISGSNNVVINGKVISGRNSKPITLDLEICVPRDFPLELRNGGITKFLVTKAPGVQDGLKSIVADLSGSQELVLKCEVGSAQIDCSGQCQVDLEKVGNCSLDCSGQCQIEITNINSQKLSVDVSGQSAVYVRGGTTDYLSVDCSGQSRVQADITADKANLEASGMSTILVDTVSSELEKDTSGMSKVRVAREPEPKSTRSGGGWSI